MLFIVYLYVTPEALKAFITLFVGYSMHIERYIALIFTVFASSALADDASSDAIWGMVGYSFLAVFLFFLAIVAIFIFFMMRK